MEKLAGDARREGKKTWDYFQRLKIPTAERLLGGNGEVRRSLKHGNIAVVG